MAKGRGRPKKRDSSTERKPGPADTILEQSHGPISQAIPEIPAIPVNSDNFCAQETPIAPERKAFPAQGFKLFKCYLGHKTYALKELSKVRCIICKAQAMPYKIEATDFCYCGHHYHRGPCLECGRTESEDGNYISRCPEFRMID